MVGCVSSPKSAKEMSLTLQAMEREVVRFQQRLPIYAHREEILKDLELNDLLVIVGETGR